MTDPIDRITIDRDICNGKPVVRGLRITVETILDYLSAGGTLEEILRQHPMLEPEDIPACLAFASRLMSHKYSVNETVWHRRAKPFTRHPGHGFPGWCEPKASSAPNRGLGPGPTRCGRSRIASPSPCGSRAQLPG